MPNDGSWSRTMHPLIKLDGRHARSFSPTKSRRTRWRACTWRSRAANTCRSPGRRAAASRRCSRSSACSTRRPKGEYTLNGRPVADLAAVGARARAQSRDRVHLPELQSDWRPERVRERRAAAHLSRHGRAERRQRVDRSARARRHGAPRQASAQPAVGRPAAARRGRARRRRRTADPARRRADRQPRFEERRSR